MGRVVPIVLLACLLPVLGARADPPAIPEVPESAEEILRLLLATEDPVVRAELEEALERRTEGTAAVAESLPTAWPPPEEATAGPFAFEGRGLDGRTLPIRGYCPEGTPPEGGWPTLLWLHGDTYRDDPDAAGEGPAILAAAAERDGFLLVAPTVSASAPWWSQTGERRILAALREAKRRFPVDADRVALAGRSDGASACFHVLVAFPDPFCAFFAFVGNPQVVAQAGGPLWNENLDARPVYAIAGGRDRLYPAEGMRAVYADLAQRGCRLTWYEEPEAGHDLSFLERRWPEILAFWKAHPREPLPREVAFATSRPGGARRAWLEVRGLDPATASEDPVEAPPGLEVPADRGYGTKPGRVAARLLAGNRFVIETDGVARLRLHLWSGLVDFDEDLAVELDGEEVFRGRPPESLAQLLEEARRGGPGSAVCRGYLDLDDFLRAGTAESPREGD